MPDPNRMPRFILTVAFSSLLIISIFIRCKKEIQPSSPKAFAGINRTIILPTDSIFLDGSQSTISNGKIVSYEWTKINGPNSFEIQEPGNAKTLVKNLQFGEYTFLLQVSSDAGLVSVDSVKVSVMLGLRHITLMILENGTDKPLSGANVHMNYCHSIVDNACIWADTLLVSDQAGQCSLNAYTFRRFDVIQSGYWTFASSKDTPTPLVISYPDGIPLSISDDPNLIDSVLVRVPTVVNVRVHIKDTSGWANSHDYYELLLLDREVFTLNGKEVVVPEEYIENVDFQLPHLPKDTTMPLTLYGNMSNKILVQAMIANSNGTSYSNIDLFSKTMYIPQDTTLIVDAFY